MSTKRRGSKSRPRVVISGYYGFGNVGDELILASIVHDLRQVGEWRIFVLSANPQKTASAYKVRAVNRSSLGDILRVLRGADLFISGGGSLFQDVTSTRSLYYYLGLIDLAQTMYKKVMVYGQGIGPINNWFNRVLANHILNNVQLITVRDEDSLKELKKLGVCRPKIVVSADPVFSYVDVGAHLGQMRIERRIGVCIRRWPKAPHLPAVVAKACDELIDKLGVEIFFFPFQPDDRFLCYEVLGMMNRKAEVLEGKNPLTFSNLINQVDILLGMRLHALILAATNYIPMVGISYDPKVNSFIRYVGQRLAGQVESLTAEELAHTTEVVFRAREEYASRLKKLVPYLRKRAEVNPKLALELARKG